MSPILGVNGEGGCRIVALALYNWELSTCCTVVTLKMLFSHWHTLPPSLAGVTGNTFRCEATAATLWLAMVKAGSCYSP
jgi:hypothetical protein